MATTFRADLRAQLVTILTAQKTATPTLLRKVESRRPGGFAETPCAYISGLTEEISWDAGTRTRRFSGAEITIADSYREGGEDVLDQLVDALIDRFNDNIQAIPNAIIEPTGVADTELAIESVDKPTTFYRGAVITLANTAKWEGRS